MKYFVLLFVVLVAGLGYVRFEQPEMWNQYLSMLKAPDTTTASPAFASTATDDQKPMSASAPTAPRPKPTAPEIISPSSNTYLNPDHVKQVDQPGQPSAASPAATSTNAATSAPAPAQAP